MTGPGSGAPGGFRAWADAELRRITDAGRRRRIRDFDAAGPSGHLAGGPDRPVIAFSSNDYLGLSQHPELRRAAHDAIDRWGTGATASRLVVGSRPVHSDLEQAVARWKRTERAVLFPTGYAANLGVLTSLGGPDCLVVSDELNHASIIDGCRLARSRVEIARHGDVDHVDHLLRTSDAPRRIVVTDAVFSMDGDEAPVAALAERCAAHGALLVLDEAHAVLGPDIDDLVEWPHLDLVRVVTLSKAMGSLGGVVAGPAEIVDLLVNRARSLIFTTGLSPADAAAARAAVDVVTGPEGERLLARLRAVVERVAPGAVSPIVPIVVGGEAEAVEASEALLARGYLVPAIRPPTVAEGTSRLRVALSAAHSDDAIDGMLAALADLGLEPGTT